MKMFPIARKRITINFILSRMKVPFEEHKHESCQMIICSDLASNISFANVSTGIWDEVFFNWFYLRIYAVKHFYSYKTDQKLHNRSHFKKILLPN